MTGYLSDVTRRRIAALLLIAAIVLGVLAVTDTGPFSDPPTQEELAQNAVVDFFDAARASDPTRMCELLTPEEQDLIVQTVAARLPPQQDLGGCHAVLEADLKTAGKGLAETHVARVNDSRVSATHAVVDVQLASPDGRSEQTFQLVLIDGQWRIGGGIT